jgi:tellurite resistance protein TerC
MLIVFFGGFVLLILALIALDLGVIGRKAHVLSMREALLRTAGWVSLAMLFNVLVYFMYEHHWLGIGRHMKDKQGNPIEVDGWDAALEFFTGYLLEQSLSVDNMFVIATIFAYFSVPLKEQHRVLFWGIMGALILRGIMIALGVVLITRFHWMVYVFGVLLIVTAAKMLFSKAEELHPDRNLMVRLARRFYPVTTVMQGSHFFVMAPGPDGAMRRMMTPLFLALILVETSDVMFAIDSIPAIFAVTSDPFIVFTSNVFAICGLRSLYFALAGLMDKFKYLKPCLVVLLAYIGVKMLFTHSYPIPNTVSLGIIGLILASGIVASLIADRRQKAPVQERASPPHG